MGNAIELIKKNGLTLKDVIACREDMLSYLTGKGVPKSTAFKISEAVRKGKGVNPDNEKIMLANNVPD
ncbi:hypothetical protein FACS189496_5520 [Bacilli bacterium]|nr:hypothetical protein FACS189496_5520 [Bacilli bacterium]